MARAIAVLASLVVGLTVLATTTGSASADDVTTTGTVLSPDQVCPRSTAPGRMSCFARATTVVTTKTAAVARLRSLDAAEDTDTEDSDASEPASTPVSGSYTPADLQAMYDLPSFSGTPTVAIVDVGHDPRAVSDLAYYRSYFKLPACTKASGCLKEVNQHGSTSNLPSEKTTWDGEIALDLQMVSAICPTCHILLVDADSDSADDLGTAVRTATNLGAQYVSMSWGGAEGTGETAYDTAYLSEPNVTYVAATGDSGYSAGTMWPAAGKGVIAAGGTTVKRTATNGTASDFTMTAWTGTGSGCSKYEAQPSGQTLIAALTKACGRRAQSDVSALADPNTGPMVRVHGEWWLIGGTSAAAPAIAAMYAIAGNHTNAGSIYGNYLIAPSRFRDVTSGATTGCPSGKLLCTAKTGWDGPTGLGSPLGVEGLRTSTKAVAPVTLSPRNPGTVTATKGRATRWNISYTGRAPVTGVTYSATGLPAGMRVLGGYVTGTPTRTGSGTATITARAVGGATPTYRTGSTTFHWKVVVHRIVRTGRIAVTGQTRRGTRVTATVGLFREDTTRGAVVHPHLSYVWYAGGTRVRGVTGRTLLLRSAWRNQRVSFTVTASGPGLVTRSFASPRSARIR